jgi:hypothetical protein
VTCTVVERVTAFVSPDPDAEVEIAEAQRRAASGDSSWREWLQDLDEGRALICQIELEITVSIDRAIERLRYREHGVWFELDSHPPVLECQAQEVAAVTLATQDVTLRGHAVSIPAGRLPGMCVHIELDDAIRALLPPPAPSG